MNEYYFEYSANVARSLYPLAERATGALEAARATVSQFLHAESDRVIVFTANATHAINLVALGLEAQVKPGKNIVTTALEHHSNFLPWKELSLRTGAELRMAPFTEEGQINDRVLADLVDENTLLVAFAAVSNVFGVQNDIAGIIRAIREKNSQTLVLVDACQAVGHFSVDIQDWDADFVVFSGHKLFGPTGIGVLTGKKSSLNALSERNVGGGTVIDACAPVTRYKELPENLEGGTPNIAGAVGLGAAIEYIEKLGLPDIREHEISLMKYTIEQLQKEFSSKLHLLGTSDAELRAGLVSFTLDGIHPHDLAQILGEDGVCVRAGEHCATPLHQALGIQATTRVSLSIYNTEADIDKLIESMKKALKVFAV